MKKHLLKKVMVVALSAMMAVELPAVNPAGFMKSFAYEAKSATVKSSSLNVRSGAGTSNSKVATLTHGQAVTIVDETTGSDGGTWAKITYAGGSGYALKSYLRTAVNYSTDESFESELSAQGFPESYKTRLREIHAEYPAWKFEAQNTGLDWNTVISRESIVGENLVYKTSKSSWKSTAKGAFDWGGDYWPGFDGGDSWVAASEGIIRYYMDPRNFLDSSYVFQFLKQGYDSGSQAASGVETLAKNTFLAGTYSGNASTGNNTGSASETAPGGTSSGNTSGSTSETTAQGSGASLTAPGSNSGSSGSSTQSTGTVSSSGATETTTGNSAGSLVGAPTASITMKTNALHAGVVKSVKPANTSPSSSGSQANDALNVSGQSGMSYIDIIMEAAEKSGVNPYVLTAMIIQEQGTKGNNGLVNGKTSGYQGIYNFFNIEAYDDGSMSAVTRGLWWASQSGTWGRPWNTIEKSIVGGAECYGENFVRNGQDTFYLKKFNVQGSNPYKHQYMTNVEGAANEGFKLGEAYSEELKNSALTFRIPVFSGMPDTAAEAPNGDGNPNNKLSSLSVSGFTLTPSFDRDTETYDLIVDPSVSGVNVDAKAINSKATVAGAGNVSLGENSNTIQITVTAQNGDQKVYKITVVKQEGGSKGSGSASQSAASSGSGTSGQKSGPGGTGTVSASGNNTATTSSGDSSIQLVSPSGN